MNYNQSYVMDHDKHLLFFGVGVSFVIIFIFLHYHYHKPNRHLLFSKKSQKNLNVLKKDLESAWEARKLLLIEISEALEIFSIDFKILNVQLKNSVDTQVKWPCPGIKIFFDEYNQILSEQINLEQMSEEGLTALETKIQIECLNSGNIKLRDATLALIDILKQDLLEFKIENYNISNKTN